MTPLCTVYELTINAYHAIFSAFHSESKIGFIKLNIYYLLSTTFKTRFFPRIFLFIVEHFIKKSKQIFQNRKAFRYQITKFLDLIFTDIIHLRNSLYDKYMHVVTLVKVTYSDYDFKGSFDITVCAFGRYHLTFVINMYM